MLIELIHQWKEFISWLKIHGSEWKEIILYSVLFFFYVFLNLDIYNILLLLSSEQIPQNFPKEIYDLYKRKQGKTNPQI